MWPFSHRSSPAKTTQKVRIRLTEAETLACAKLLDDWHIKPRNQDHEAGTILWQWIRRTLGDRYIPCCRVTIDTDDKAQFSVIFHDAPLPKTS